MSFSFYKISPKRTYYHPDIIPFVFFSKGCIFLIDVPPPAS
ncbi:hypothetical protein SACS_1395 [Parasaccharibacter apium]|uniref:Uncharacterized protein n=1 Tax=Parasaccharibacter apium TaxID=1510841 RepID=A0A7U7G6R1_9PROT|nr:hypothetical protein SACS_1395 [Parasaccharibacter apium]